MVHERRNLRVSVVFGRAGSRNTDHASPLPPCRMGAATGLECESHFFHELWAQMTKVNCSDRRWTERLRSENLDTQLRLRSIPLVWSW